MNSPVLALLLAAAAVPELVINHVTVIDGTGAPAKPDQTVVVTGDRITASGKTGDVKAPEKSQVIDATGKFLIPGLWDMHGHLTDAGEGAISQLVLNGVTGVRDMGGNLELVDRLRDEIRKGKRVGPDIVRAGPFVDGSKPGVAHRLTVLTPDEARAAVATLKMKGVDFIKVHNGISKEAFLALSEEAKKYGLPLAVHLPLGMTSGELSDAGAKSLEHIETLFESVLRRTGATAKTIDEAYVELTGDAATAMFKKFVANGTWFDPTLVAYERGFVLWSNKPEAMGKRRPVQEKHIALVSAMHKAGVRLLAGSDFSDWALVPGVDLHNELALLVQAGLSPMEALQAATSGPAEFLGRREYQGTIELGRFADLVLLDMDPLESISHTRKINAVVLRGKLLRVAEMRDRIVNGR